MAGTTTRDPITGEIKFRDPQNTVINETTGQTADTLTPAPQPVQPAPTPTDLPEFKIPRTTGVDVGALDSSVTTDTVFDFHDELTRTTSAQKDLQQKILDLSQPSPELQSAMEDLNRVREDRNRLFDFSEDRQVDIGTIRGEQDQIDRTFTRREQTAINRLNILLAAKGQKLDALTTAYQFTQDNLNTFLALQETTQPDVMSTQTDPATGEVFAFVRNSDGSMEQISIGQLTPEVAGLDFLAKGTYTNANNQEMFYGVTSDGEIIQQVLGDARAPADSVFSDKDISNNILKVRTAVTKEKAFQDFTDVMNAYQNTKVGYDLNNAAGDLAIVNGIAKILDPGSVIRPSEFETVKEAQGFFEEVANLPFKVTSGRIAGSGTRARLLELAERLVIEKATPIQQNLQSSFAPVATGLGVSLNDAIPEINQLSNLVATINAKGGDDDGLRKEAEAAGIDIVDDSNSGSSIGRFFNRLFGN